METTRNCVALITGITGQDGSYLAEQLLLDGWEVHGIMRRSSVFTTGRIEHIWETEGFTCHHGDVTDIAGITHILAEIAASNPEKLYIFNLAAQSHVGVSFETPLYTAQVDAIGTLNMLEAIRSVGLTEKARFYQASTSEMFGKVQEIPQTESTPFYPRSPYGVAKLYSHWIVKNYREAYGMFACSGILFNHESIRRGKTFVTRKITCAAGAIVRALESGRNPPVLLLGNLDSIRDWGHARDYVRGMVMMLDADHPDDYVLATNETHSVREFVEATFRTLRLEITWSGDGLNEVGIITWRDGQHYDVVHVSEKYFRPTEVDYLQGDATKARDQLGWKPSYSFNQLVEEMALHDYQNLNSKF